MPAKHMAEESGGILPERLKPICNNFFTKYLTRRFVWKIRFNLGWKNLAALSRKIEIRQHQNVDFSILISHKTGSKKTCNLQLLQGYAEKLGKGSVD